MTSEGTTIQDRSRPTASTRPTKVRRRRRSPRRVAQRVGNYALLSFAAVFFVIPFLILLTTSLTPLGETLFADPPRLFAWPATLDAYVTAFNAVPLLTYLGNSLLYVVTIVPLSAGV